MAVSQSHSGQALHQSGQGGDGNYSDLLSLIIMSVKSGGGVEERARRNVMTGMCTLYSQAVTS